MNKEVYKPCYDLLKQTSRTFSACVKEEQDRLDDEMESERSKLEKRYKKLPYPLNDIVCVFYLILRALDTIEDDPELSIEVKQARLLAFSSNLKQDVSYTCSQKQYQSLMGSFGSIVIKAYLTFDDDIQRWIRLEAERMSIAMSEMLLCPFTTWEEYDMYSFAVSGGLSLPLTHIFAYHGYADMNTVNVDHICNYAKLLQRVNIIRDVYEDDIEGRQFWPKEFVLQHVPSFQHLFHTGYRDKALLCLNGMIEEAFRFIVMNQMVRKYKNMYEYNGIQYFFQFHFIVCLAYLSNLYNVYEVFSRTIDVSKEEMVTLRDNRDHDSVVIRSYLVALLNKCTSPLLRLMIDICLRDLEYDL